MVEELDHISIGEDDQLCFIQGSDQREGLDQFLDASNSLNILDTIDYRPFQSC